MSSIPSLINKMVREIKRYFFYKSVEISFYGSGDSNLHFTQADPQSGTILVEETDPYRSERIFSIVSPEKHEALRQNTVGKDPYFTAEFPNRRQYKKFVGWLERHFNTKNIPDDGKTWEEVLLRSLFEYMELVRKGWGHIEVSDPKLYKFYRRKARSL